MDFLKKDLQQLGIDLWMDGNLGDYNDPDHFTEGGIYVHRKVPPGGRKYYQEFEIRGQFIKRAQDAIRSDEDYAYPLDKTSSTPKDTDLSAGDLKEFPENG